MADNKDIQVSNSTLFLHSAGSGVVGIKMIFELGFTLLQSSLGLRAIFSIQITCFFSFF